MTPTIIAAPNYHLADVHQRELGAVFRRHWQFAGMSGELSANRDFVCVDYPGCDVVVQNFRGELRAFQNVCTHRFNRLQTDDRGNRPLMCGYHGWTYDETGFPAGRPRKEQFADADREQLCLERYRVETCGQFVFFSMVEDGPSLRDWLGDYHDVLEQLGTGMGRQVHYGLMPHAANWKLLVENVLECYHCATVHPQTFVAGLGVGRAPIEQISSDAHHSSAHFPKEDRPQPRARVRALAHLDRRAFAHSSYFHIFVFPNLFVASIEGLSFYVGHVLPVAPAHSLLRMRFFEPDVPLTANQRVLQDAINQQNLPFGERVIAEDRTILEQVQRGVEATTKPGLLGTEEVRIAAFHAAWHELMAA